jgi:hypothetical protein
MAARGGRPGRAASSGPGVAVGVVRAVGPWLLVHMTVVLSVLAGGIGVLALVLFRRPWLVEAERQGLDPPRRAWRVTGWRRSGRCAREVAGAIAQGRLDVEPANANPADSGPSLRWVAATTTETTRSQDR